MALLTDTFGFGPGLRAGIDRARVAFTAARARRAAVRQTMNELDSLNDRELNDLGISRSDIPTIARSSVR